MKATLIPTALSPKEIDLPGKYLDSFDAVYPLIDTDTVQMIEIGLGQIMLLDENGKLRGKPFNEQATMLALGNILPDDFIVGDVVVMPGKLLR